MPVTQISADDFIKLHGSLPVLDVRSPAEYAHAHIPGALCFPLFDNEERKVIGTAYKQESREKAIKIGLGSFGKNMVKMVEDAEAILNGSKEVIVHCWRGGMRSEAVAWLLNLYGFKVYLLEGGYKSYRRWALQQFEKPYTLGIIGGYTGSNKTGLIQLLKKRGKAVIDLEVLAGHMGSAFGNLAREAQPSQEQFENLLALELNNITTRKAGETIWIEHESQRIGQVNIPMTFFSSFAHQHFYFFNIPFEARLQHIIKEYGKASKESLINAIVRITKRLGGLEAKTAINFLVDDDIESCFRILLAYYDKWYRRQEDKLRQDKGSVVLIESAVTDANININKLLNHANSV